MKRSAIIVPNFYCKRPAFIKGQKIREAVVRDMPDVIAVFRLHESI